MSGTKKSIVNIVVDLQAEYGMPGRDRMQTIEAQEAYMTHVLKQVEKLRKKGIPTIWLTMDGASELMRGTPSDAPQPRAMADLEKSHFFMSDKDLSEKMKLDGEPGFISRLKTLFSELGPKTDEDIYRKPYFGAFFDREYLKERPGLQAHVDSQAKNPVQIGPSLRERLREMGAEHVTIMGGAAEVCVTETSIGAATSGLRCTVLADCISGHADPAWKKSPEEYKTAVRDCVEMIVNGEESPQALRHFKTAGFSIRENMAGQHIFSDFDKSNINENLKFSTSGDFLSSLEQGPVSKFMLQDSQTQHNPQAKVGALPKSRGMKM